MSSLPAQLAVIMLLLMFSAPVVRSQWEPPDPIRTAEDFERATARAWGAATGEYRNLKFAQQLITQALAWALDHPALISRSRLALAQQEAGDIASGNREYDQAEALFREELGNLDASDPPDPSAQYQALRRIVQLGWYNGHPDRAVGTARRLGALSPAILQNDLRLAMAEPDPVAGPRGDLFSGPPTEPDAAAFRPVRNSLNTIAATLVSVPEAKAELGQAVMAREAAVQTLAAAVHDALLQQETHPPRLPDALGDYSRALPREPPDGRLGPLDRLRANAAAMSLLAYANPNIIPAQLPQPRLLRSERMGLERQAARSLSDEKAAPPEEVWKAVPQHAVVLQYATYVPPPTIHDKQGEARYLAIAFSSDGVLAVADIGGFDDINALVSSACRAILRDIEQGRHCFRKTPGELPAVPGLKIAAGRLYQALITPVAHVLTGARHLIIVPDGPLAFFPFEALVDADGEYLIRHYLVSYIQSPVEIPRWQQSTPPSHGPPVILADPDYDAGRQSDSEACPAPDSSPRILRAGEDLKGFSRLCNAAAEAAQVQQAMPEARVLMRQEATEEAVKGLYSPRVLHLATHGFVTGSLDWPPEWFRAEEYGIWWTRQDYDVMDDDAWLHAGLVFAGANPRRSPGGHDDGLLSAREASLLHLRGTQLVVMSACDSGLGVARAGDGVFGLRRAIVLAGARAQTFSLWPVADETTPEFMRRYYALLAEGLPNSEALALVKREFLAKGPPWSDPWAWAVFVGYGYPGALGP